VLVSGEARRVEVRNCSVWFGLGLSQPQLCFGEIRMVRYAPVVSGSVWACFRH
jgi:hypothetical protein